jgi:uncharacterized protein YjbI with pentapeptide repeats
MDRNEALKLLTGGENDVAEWNRRRAAGEAIPALSWADLRDVDLSCTKLTKAYLHDADLSGARLVYTNLNIAELFGDGNRGTETGTRLETELDRPFW